MFGKDLWLFPLVEDGTAYNVEFSAHNFRNILAPSFSDFFPY